MWLIQNHEVPHDKTVNYARFVCDYRPQNNTKQQNRITVGGYIFEYQGEVPTKRAGLTTIKLVLNSVISSAGERFMTADVKNFYLKTPMKDIEYMRIPIKHTTN